MTPSMRPHSFRYRLRESLAILCGRLPARLTTIDALTAAQGELAQSRAELAKIAKVAAEVRAQVDILESEIDAKSDQLKQYLDTSRDLEARLRLLANPGQSERSMNDSIVFPIPEVILSEARDKEFRVIDVGAQILESSDHVYSQLLTVLSGKVIGFEPLTEELNKRLAQDVTATLLPHAIGTGHPSVLHVTQFNPASSLLRPNHLQLDQFLALPEMLTVVSELPMETRRLDDVPGLDGCTLLKVDIQGGELAVLQGASGTLRDVMAVFIEVEFLDLYQEQPLFPAVHSFLEEQGFELLDLMNLGYGSYREANCGDVRSKLLWADGFYVRKLDVA